MLDPAKKPNPRRVEKKVIERPHLMYIDCDDHTSLTSLDSNSLL